jgi:hypothetical protein
MIKVVWTFRFPTSLVANLYANVFLMERGKKMSPAQDAHERSQTGFTHRPEETVSIKRSAASHFLQTSSVPDRRSHSPSASPRLYAPRRRVQPLRSANMCRRDRPAFFRPATGWRENIGALLRTPNTRAFFSLSHRTKRFEGGAHIRYEERRLFPRREVRAFGMAAVVDEFHIRLLCPAFRCLINFFSKRAHAHRKLTPLASKKPPAGKLCFVSQ